jgi:hypothetical protein
MRFSVAAPAELCLYLYLYLVALGSQPHVLQGISSHFEDTRSFGDVIITVSLIQPIYMTLKRPRELTNECCDLLAETKVLLEPRSCLVMSGPCRYLWRHGITKAKRVTLPDGSVVYRGPNYRRLSLTIRRVLDSRRRVERGDDTVGWKGL